jgi:hypothetical protein
LETFAVLQGHLLVVLFALAEEIEGDLPGRRPHRHPVGSSRAQEGRRSGTRYRGVPITNIAAHVGHSRKSLTLDTYGHVLIDDFVQKGTAS